MDKGIGLDVYTLMKELEILQREKPVGYEMEEYALILSHPSLFIYGV